jgi:tRNA(Met) cytidine acetyltransferase
VTFEAVSQDSWRQQDGLAEAMYQLLSGALPHIAAGFAADDGCAGPAFTCARTSNGVAGALWLVGRA